jgi:Fic family protein
LENWKQAGGSAELLREYQIEHLLQSIGNTLDRVSLFEAAGKISSWAAESEAKFSAERLMELHGALIGSNAELRKNEPRPLNAMHDPTPAILLPKMIDNAFDWFTTESFAELHPVEQASVVYLRLMDLYPFAQATEPTAMLVAGFYTERAGLPPLVITSDDITQARFAQAFEAAFRMLTQPLVELFAEMLRSAMKLNRS